MPLWLIKYLPELYAVYKRIKGPSTEALPQYSASPQETLPMQQQQLPALPSPQSSGGGAGGALRALLLVGVIVILFVFGRIPLGLSTYVGLIIIGISLAIVGILLAVLAGIMGEWIRMALGLFVVLGGLYTFSVSFAYTKDTGAQSLIREKFPVVGICEGATEAWENRPRLWFEPEPTPPTPAPGLREQIEGLILGPTQTPVPIPTATPVPTPTPTFLEGLIPGE